MKTNRAKLMALIVVACIAVFCQWGWASHCGRK